MAQNWKTLLICPDSKMSAHFSPLAALQVSLGSIFELPTYPYRSVLNETLAGNAPQICFLDVSSDPDRAMTTIDALLGIQPKIQIVALLNGNTPDLILRSLRAGAAEFLIEPFSMDQLRPALEKLNRLRPGGQDARGGVGRAICVMPAKGGSGGTTIAANLAIQWRKATGGKVLLADLDCLTGTLSFVLKTKSTYSFMDALSRASSLDEELWKGLVVVNHGVDVLLSPDNPVDGIRDTSDPSPILEFSRSLYETIFVDTSGVYGDWNLCLAQLCDEILMVTTNELSSLQGAQRAMSFLEKHQVPRAKIRLIVNRYNKDVGLSKEVIETALHAEVFQVIGSDYEALQVATLEGKPAPPSSSFGKGIVELSGFLGGKPSEARKAREEQKPAGLSGLFSLFSKKSAASR